MSRITTENVAAAIRMVSSMNLPQKEESAEEIHRYQPHLLASCVVQPKLAPHMNDVEFPLNILLLCYQAIKESGLRWPVITEDEQQRQMQRWIKAADLSENALSSGASYSARQRYVEAAAHLLITIRAQRIERILRSNYVHATTTACARSPPSPRTSSPGST